MRVIWIGTYANGSYLEELQADGTYVQNASNLVQQYYIETIEQKYDIDVFSALVTNSYPKGRLLLKENKTDLINGLLSNVGFLNLPYINQYIQKNKLKKLVKHSVKKSKKDESYLVFVYAPRVPFLYAASIIKKQRPNTKVINIIPDLPQYMYTGGRKKTKIKTFIQEKMLERYKKYVDGYVLYTKYMADFLSIPDNKYIVIEGIYKDKKICIKREKKEKQEKQVVLYAGGLNKKYGIDMLVEGFLDAHMVNAELHLYGSGDYVDEIKNISTINASIVYGGSISAYDAYIKMCEADLLINPRPSNNSFTKYSCPSKTLEYMATGSPALVTRLDGIPDEYFNYVYTIENESRSGIAEAIQRVLSIPEEERLHKAKLAQDFINEYKNAEYQVNKIIEFSETLTR